MHEPTRRFPTSPKCARPGTNLGALFLSCAVWGTQPAPSQEEPDRVEGARTALEKWVETRRVLSMEKRDWVLAKDTLNERIAIVRREIEALRTRIKDAEKSLGEADAKRAELAAENERLKAASAALTGTVAALEGRTQALLVRLPEPIRERVRPLSQRLPQSDADTKLTLAERFQDVVGILNEVNKFNREITVTSEVRTLTAGVMAEVTALYVGIGQGYFASADGRSAGIGTATATGWEWTPADHAAAEISRALGILANEQPADFVRLPIRID